ncbi:C40 family peptidase [bacterium]|nr:C40 family peptidase [bacterium]MBU1957322.1 C40 family peptidase [bacterium]
MHKVILDGLFFLFTTCIFIGCMGKPNVSIENMTLLESNNSIIQEAKKYLGKPYQDGAIGPDSFDCSGFVYGVHKNLGISIPRTSLDQSNITGQKLTKEALKVGDLVFFDTSLKGHVNHSGIYLGNDKFIHASSGKAYSVTISDMNGWYKDKFRWGKHINENK